MINTLTAFAVVDAAVTMCTCPIVVAAAEITQLVMPPSKNAGATQVGRKVIHCYQVNPVLTRPRGLPSHHAVADGVSVVRKGCRGHH